MRVKEHSIINPRRARHPEKMSAKNRTLTYAAAAVIVAAGIIVAAIATNPSLLGTQSSSAGTGSLNIYLTDAPPSSLTFKYLLVNVSSIELRYQGSLATTITSTSVSTGTSTTVTYTSISTSMPTPPENLYRYSVPANVGTNVNLTSLHGKSLLLGATSMPAGQVTSIVINITGAKAFYTNGASEQLKVAADGKLMIPIQFGINSGGTTNLTIDITPNLVHISQGDVLTPVLHVTAVEQGQNSSETTHTAEVDESSTST